MICFHLHEMSCVVKIIGVTLTTTQSGISIETIGTTGLLISHFLWFLSLVIVNWWLLFSPLSLLSLDCPDEYAMFAYSCRNGQMLSRNCEKSLRIPNHPVKKLNTLYNETFLSFKNYIMITMWKNTLNEM